MSSFVLPGISTDNIYEKTTGAGVTIDGLLIQNGIVTSLNNVQNTKSNFTAIAAPIATDDSSNGYSVGSIWIYSNVVYICTDATIGAAVWKNTSTSFFTAESLGESSTTSNTYITKLNLVATTATANYLLIWSCGIYSENERSNLQIQLDGITTIYEMLDGVVKNGYQAQAGHAIISLTAASHTISMNYSEASSNTTFIKYARISLLRL